MRKLAWFVIITLTIALAIAVGCAYSPDFSKAVYSFGVDTVGTSTVNIVTGAMTGMMAWGATGLAPAAAVFFSIAIGFTVLWTVVLRKYILNPIRGQIKTNTSSNINVPAPAPNPIARAENDLKPPVVEKKEEVTV